MQSSGHCSGKNGKGTAFRNVMLANELFVLANKLTALQYAKLKVSLAQQFSPSCQCSENV